ncbi:MAG TPA: glutaredoxin family protein [Syntrophobacteria bacterium]|nr:glutaredoxin family protein [Syntrophobacteria bacterium]
MNMLRLTFIASLVLLILTGFALAGHNVELYTTSWCPYCTKARDFFRSRGVPFTEYDVEKDKEAAQRYRQMNSRGGVPFVVIDGQRIAGFSEAAYEKALKSGR